jgi:hypothetical protein
MKDDMKQQLREGADQATEKARTRAEGMKSQVTEQAEKAADALGAAAEEFESRGQESLGHMLAELSRNLGDLAKRVERKSLDELVQEGGRIAERNPLLFIAGSVAAGVMLSRFFKAHASSGASHQGQEWQREFGEHGSSDYDRGYGATPGRSGYGQSDFAEGGRSYGAGGSYGAGSGDDLHESSQGGRSPGTGYRDPGSSQRSAQGGGGYGSGGSYDREREQGRERSREGGGSYDTGSQYGQHSKSQHDPLSRSGQRGTSSTSGNNPQPTNNPSQGDGGNR